MKKVCPKLDAKVRRKPAANQDALFRKNLGKVSMNDDLSHTGDAAHRHWIMVEPGQASDVAKPHKQAGFALT